MTGHIFIYGEIGTQVTAKSVQDQIDKNAEDYEVHISSVGGDVYEGYAIYGILQGLQKPTTVVIEGLCASIATLIAQAGDKVVMTAPAEFMIHNPNVSLEGESADLIEAAGQLDRIKNTIISVYQKRTGISTEQLSAMMDDETWMTADEAKQRGFIDEVQDKLKAVAFIDTSKIKMSKDKNTLMQILDKGFAELKNMISPKSMAMVTLEDGRVVTVGTESETPTPEEMVGATVVLEDGTALIDGEYKTVEGVSIVVEGGIVVAALAAPAPEEAPAESVEDLKAKIAELEAALAGKDAVDAVVVELEGKVESQNKTIKQFKASVEKLEAKYNELKNVAVGDPNAPVDEPKVEEQPEFDPMAEHLHRYFEGRGINFK